MNHQQNIVLVTQLIIYDLFIYLIGAGVDKDYSKQAKKIFWIDSKTKYLYILVLYFKMVMVFKEII